MATMTAEGDTDPHLQPLDQDLALATGLVHEAAPAPALAAPRTPARALSPAAPVVAAATAAHEAEAFLPPLVLSRPPTINPTTTAIVTNRPSVPTTNRTSSCKATPAQYHKFAYPPMAAGLPRRRPTARPRSGTPAQAPTSRPSSATWPASHAWPGRPTATRSLPDQTTRRFDCGIGSRAARRMLLGGGTTPGMLRGWQ